MLSFAAKHQQIKPYTPTPTAKVERYQQTLVHELLYAQVWDSETWRRQAISRLIHHNYHRSHTTAGGKPPASCLKTGVTNARPTTTSGAPAPRAAR